MFFYIFTAISGITLIFGTMLALKILSERLQLRGPKADQESSIDQPNKRIRFSRKIFWRAGLMLLVIDIFYLAVVGNMTSIWPGIETLPLVAKAALFGLISGLFFELGRFMVLDKVMKNIRSFPEGLLFGFGWSGVEAFFLGILMVVSIAGMHLLVTTPDLTTAFPNASPEEIEQLKGFQQQITTLFQGNPLIGLLPLFERFVQILMDIALTLLLLLGFRQGHSFYVWGAVGLRTLFTMLLIIATGLFGLWGELVLIMIGLLSYMWILKIKEVMNKN